MRKSEPVDNRILKFPRGFVWGASTASHQVEGNNNNNWSLWEQSDYRLKDLENRGLIQKYGIENYISGTSCNHYNLYKNDFKLAKLLNHNATRISIEWSRIEPEEGVFDDKEIKHYKDVIKSIRENGMEPFITIWHWTIPVWLDKKGGWKSSRISKCFERYTSKLAQTLGPDIKFWITLNEPEIFSGNSYLEGIWPPQEKNLISYLLVLNNLIHAHRLAYKVIKKSFPKSKVGLAKNNIYFEAYKNKFKNKVIKTFIDWWWNKFILDNTANYLDFIGLNHYFHNKINDWLGKNDNIVTSDMGWELYPEGIYHALCDLKGYNKPVYITENGLADSRDEKRTWYIHKILVNVHKAIKSGVNVKGYLHWSLMDNFEWDSGYWPQFGLIEVDQKTKIRTIRKSAKYYAEICKTNRIDPLTYNKFSNS